MCTTCVSHCTVSNLWLVKKKSNNLKADFFWPFTNYLLCWDLRKYVHISVVQVILLNFPWIRHWVPVLEYGTDPVITAKVNINQQDCIQIPQLEQYTLIVMVKTTRNLHEICALLERNHSLCILSHFIFIIFCRLTETSWVTLPLVFFKLQENKLKT